MARSRSRIRIARLSLRLLCLLAALLVGGGVMMAWYLGTRPADDSLGVSPTTLTVGEDASRPWEVDPSLPHPLDPVLELARYELARLESEVLDYTAILNKQERIDGRLGEEEKLAIKIINRKLDPEGKPTPLHVYLRFEEPSRATGREVIWIEGKNDGNLIAHEGGWMNLMRVQIDPKGSLAMMGNKYPLTQIGVVTLLKKLIEKGERDRKYGECQVEVDDQAVLDGVACTKIEVIHPVPRPHFDFHRARIHIDRQRHVPLKYEAYLWPSQPDEAAPLEEAYYYAELEVNVGLTEEDFNPDNANYSFPK